MAPRFTFVVMFAMGAAAVAACQRSEPQGSLGTIRIGAKADPKFDQSWRGLAESAGANAEVFYIEDDRGEGLMGRVRRAAKSVPRPAPPPEDAPDATASPAEADEPSGDAVASIVRSNLPAVKFCYLRITRSGKLISGRAIVSFTVGREGAVENVKVEAPAFSETDLPQCITQQVQRWAFPKSKKGGLAFAYPFVFVGG